MPLEQSGKASPCVETQARRPAGLDCNSTVGCDGKDDNMTTQTVSVSSSNTGFGAAIFAALIGVSMIFMVGVAQSATLHDAAHDLRHATGFPCH